jgi:hypothetical protein
MEGLPCKQELERVSAEMSLYVLVYNIKRMLNIFGVSGLIKAIQV